MSVLVFFRKSYVKAHQRRIKSGQVITIPAHYDKRTKKGADAPLAHGHDLRHLDEAKRATFEKMHAEQHLLHHYHAHALRQRVQEQQGHLEGLAKQVADHRAAGRHVEAAKRENQRLRLYSRHRVNQRELDDIEQRLAGLAGMKEALVQGSGAIDASTADSHKAYAAKLGDRFKAKPEADKPSVVTDAAGAPLVVYHGSDRKIDTFADQVTFVTAKQSYADGFGAGGVVMPLHAHITHPASADQWDEARKTTADNSGTIKERQEVARKKLIAQGYDGVVVVPGKTWIAFHGQQLTHVAQPEKAETFTPTHELPDGTPVRATDEKGVYTDASGAEIEDDYAKPIKAAAPKPTVVVTKPKPQPKAPAVKPEVTVTPPTDPKDISAHLSALADQEDSAADDWASRKYQGNNQRIDLAGDGPLKTPETTVGAANESRRAKAIDQHRGNAAALRRAAKMPAGELVARVREVLDKPIEANRNLSEAKEYDLALAAAVLGMRDGQVGPGSPGRLLREAVEPVIQAQRQSEQAEKDRLSAITPAERAQQEKETEDFWNDFLSDKSDAEVKAKHPQEGDTKSENGIDYVLKDGRWHRTTAEMTDPEDDVVDVKAKSDQHRQAVTDTLTSKHGWKTSAGGYLEKTFENVRPRGQADITTGTWMVQIKGGFASILRGNDKQASIMLADNAKPADLAAQIDQAVNVQVDKERVARGLKPEAKTPTKPKTKPNPTHYRVNITSPFGEFQVYVAADKDAIPSDYLKDAKTAFLHDSGGGTGFTSSAQVKVVGDPVPVTEVPAEASAAKNAEWARIAKVVKPEQAAPVAPEIPTDDLDPSSPNYRYRDTGYVGGSRKELAAAMLRTAKRDGRQVRKNDVDWETLETNPREAKEVITKSHLFGTVDWEGLKTQGLTPGAGFVMDRVYASVGTGPRDDTPQARQDYALGLETLRNRLEVCRTPEEIEKTLAELKEERDGVNLNADETARFQELEKQAEAAYAPVQAYKKQEYELDKAVGIAHRVFYAAESPAGHRRGGKYTPDQQADIDKARSGLEAAQQAKQALVDAHPEMQEQAVTVHTPKGTMTTWTRPADKEWRRIRQQQDVLVAVATARNQVESPMLRAWSQLGERFNAVLDYRGRGSDTFHNHIATAKLGRIKDWSWQKTGGTKAPRQVTEEGKRFQLQVADSHERVGGRAVPVASTADLKERFGLREVQSGNWVLRDPVSAKFHTEQTAGALADLADILGITDQQVAMNGRVALAFGARGTGNAGGVAARAHYEPVGRIINLTKMGGGGCLAHEWLHGLDNLLLESQGGDAKADDFLTEDPSLLPPGPLRNAFQGLRDAFTTGQHRIKQRLIYTPEHYRLAQQNIARTHMPESMREYGLPNAVRIIKEARDASMALDKLEILYEPLIARGQRGAKKHLEDWRNVALAYHGGQPEGGSLVVETGKPQSSFAMEAQKLDNGAIGKYWSKPHEMAARAFQSYVEDKLASQGRRNDYLSAKADNKYYRMDGVAPFPEGEERTRINAAFDKLIAAMQADNSLAKALARTRYPRRLVVFRKSYIHGHYRKNPKTGEMVWVESYSDKRTTRQGQTLFAHDLHRQDHFKQNLAEGRLREAMHSFHDLDHDAAHKLAGTLGLHNGDKHADKKELMRAVRGKVLQQQQDYQAQVKMQEDKANGKGPAAKPAVKPETKPAAKPEVTPAPPTAEMDMHAVMDSAEKHLGTESTFEIFDHLPQRTGDDPRWSKAEMYRAIMAIQKERKADKHGKAKHALLEANGGSPLGIEAKKPDSNRHALILPDASSPGKYRYSAYDEHGFYTHATHDTADQALDEAIKEGFTEHAPGSLDRLSQTDTWAQGMQRAEEAQAGWKAKPTSDDTAQTAIHAAVAKRFKLPVDVVKNIATDTPEAMIKRGKSDDKVPNNGESPAEFDRYPLGSVRMEDFGGDPKDRYVDFLRTFDPKDLTTAEAEQAIKQHPTYSRYLAWSKEGKEAPYITVYETDSGKLQSTNRRRTLVAQEVGKPITGWFGPHNPETGNPLKYGDVLAAIKEAQATAKAPAKAPASPPEAPAAKTPSQSTPAQPDPEDQVLDINGAEVPYAWKLVDAEDLAPTSEKADNQFRDRTRAASDEQVASMAANLKFRLLSDSPLMDYGAPVLAQDGKTIIGGNGRSLAIRRAYGMGQADGYQKDLTKRAARFGIDPAAVAKMKAPVLVRVLQQDVDIKQAAIASNEGGGARMSALEQARVDGERLGDLSDFEADEEGDFNNRANLPFIRRFLGTMPVAQRSAFQAADGGLSQEGISRLRNAVLYRAYGDSDVLSRLVESADPAQRNVLSALTRAAPTVAQASADVKAGNLHDLDVSADIVAATTLLAQVRGEGKFGSVDEYLNQQNLFGDPLSDATKIILKHFDRNLRSSKAMAGFLTDYYAAVRQIGDPKQMGMFADATPDKPTLLRQTDAQRQNAPSPQAALF